MIKLNGGPAEGSYAVKRAPIFLRAVIPAKVGRAKPKGDVLDQLEDTPAEGESVSVYQREGEAGIVHINGRKVKGFYATAEYHWLEDVDGEALRDNDIWQEWAIVQMDRIQNDDNILSPP